MTFMNVQLLHNGTDITEQLISYNREKYICTGIGTISIVVLDTDRVYDPWDEMVLYEEGHKKGTFYVRATRTEKGEEVLECQDKSALLIDYFVSEQTSLSYTTYARYWIEKYLNEAGVSYTITTDGNGAPLNTDMPFGLATAYEIIQNLLQLSNWYMYFNANGRCIIGSLTLQTGHPKERLTDDEILSIQYNKNDKMLRNRAVVWGGADLMNQSWVFADISVDTRWNYDSTDKRAVVLSNSTIQTYYDADRLARQMLNEFARITEEKTVGVAGEVDVELGDYVFISSHFQRGGGMITTLASSLSKSGFITTLTLDQRCPRLFGFVGNYADYVYIGTEASGVWRKELDGTLWTDYSTGLTDLGITDLSINSGVFASTTKSGLLFYKDLYSNWIPFGIDSAYFPSGAFPSGGVIVPSGIVPSGYYAVCCTLDKMDQSIYGGFATNSGILQSGFFASGLGWSGAWASGDSWVIKLDTNGNFLRSDKVIFTVGDELFEHVTIIDMDNNGAENVLSVIAGGPIVYVRAPDDGDFGNKTEMVGYSTWGSEWKEPLNSHVVYRPTTSNQNTATTDQDKIVSTLPQASTDFSVIEVTTDTLYGNHIGMAYNQGEDLGTFWAGRSFQFGGEDTIDIFKNEWGDQSWEFGRAIYQTVELWSAGVISNLTHGKMVAFWKRDDNDVEYVALYEKIDTTNMVIDYYMYEIDTFDNTVTLVASKTQQFYPYGIIGWDTTYVPSHIFSGNIYFSQVNAGVGVASQQTRFIFICNLKNYTITTYDYLYIDSGNYIRIGDDAGARCAHFSFPTVCNGYIVSAFVVWEKSVASSSYVVGKIKFFADYINKYTGEVTRTGTTIDTVSDEICDDLTLCSSWSLVTSENDTAGMGDNYGTVPDDGYWLEYQWQFNTSTSVYYYFPMNTRKNIINKHYPSPPYPPDTPTCCHDLPDTYTFKIFGVKATPVSTPTGVWEDESIKIGTDPYPFVPDSFAQNNDWYFTEAPFGIYGGDPQPRFSCGSKVRNEWWMIKGYTAHTSGSARTGYCIYDVKSGIPSLIGYIHPENMPDPAYHPDDWTISYVLPQTDDIDGTIYILWFNGWGGGSTYFLAGHAPTGGITKRISDGGYGGALRSTIVGNSIVTPGLSYNMSATPSANVTRFWDYDQLTGNTINDFIVRQKDSTMEAIYWYPTVLNVDTSKSAPTVIYNPSLSGQMTSLLGVSVDNTSGSFTVNNTTFPILDVRTFDISNSGVFTVESGNAGNFFRYIGFVNNGGFYCIDALLTSASGIHVTTASGTTMSGATASGAVISGLTKLETSNISPTTPYFFLASPSGFWQRNPGLPDFVDYSYSLPGSTITIIRVDDRL